MSATVRSRRPGGYDHALCTRDGVTFFLYLLLRDHLTPGVVEAIVVEHIEATAGNERVFSNDWLAAYAIELAARLRGLPPADALSKGHAKLKEAQEH